VEVVVVQPVIENQNILQPTINIIQELLTDKMVVFMVADEVVLLLLVPIGIMELQEKLVLLIQVLVAEVELLLELD